MTVEPRFEWNLRLKMAENGLFKTTELHSLLKERGLRLSREQVYRLVTGTPQRLNMELLAALCEILSCTPNDLITVHRAAALQAVNDSAPAGTEKKPARQINDITPIRAQINKPGTQNRPTP